MRRYTFKPLTFLLPAFLLLIFPFILNAEFYEYTDEKGVKTFTDTPRELPTDASNSKVHVEEYDHLSPDEKQVLLEKRKIEKREQAKQKRLKMLKTRVEISNNQILVPVTFRNSYHEVTVNLLLDTGANITVVDAYVAQKLNIKKGQLGAATVAGGGKISTLVVDVDQIQVGGQKINFHRIMITQHSMSNRFHGLLGQDFLGRFRYTIDYKNSIIQWIE